MSAAPLPSADPLPLYRYRDGLYAADLLAAALTRFDFFSRLAAQPADHAGVCRLFGFAPRPADVMLTLFTAMGLLEKAGGVFQLTALAREFLVKDSPWFMAPYFAALKDRPVCRDYVEVLQTGKPAHWGGYQDGKDWARAMEDDAFAEQFTAAMDCRGAYLAPALARALDCRGLAHALDIAGGSGVYACALVEAHPHLRATVLEKPPVDRVAARAIERRDATGRVEVRAGDMFAEELPGGCDLHLFSNVLHDWEEPAVLDLLAKSFRALTPGGLLVIHDMHLNEDKSGPLHVAEYSALLMHSTWGKCYSLGELRDFLARLGFTEMQFTPTAAGRSAVTARKPR
jgi:SAM-dependent methyltransferase